MSLRRCPHAPNRAMAPPRGTRTAKGQCLSRLVRQPTQPCRNTANSPANQGLPCPTTWSRQTGLPPVCDFLMIGEGKPCFDDSPLHARYCATRFATIVVWARTLPPDEMGGEVFIFASAYQIAGCGFVSSVHGWLVSYWACVRTLGRKLALISLDLISLFRFILEPFY